MIQCEKCFVSILTRELNYLRTNFRFEKIAGSISLII